MSFPMPPRQRRRGRGRGRGRAAFTLIEVLLAVLVLGMFLTIAFTKQAESVVLESRARLEAAAASQVRCKMSEIELTLARDGFPPADEADSGPCCEVFEDDRFACSWTIVTIELPSVTDLQEAAQADRTQQSLVAFGDDSTEASFEEQTTSFLSMAALGRILPVVQSLLTGAIRKVEVTIVWRYRNKVYDFTVAQYMTATGENTLNPILQSDLVQGLLQGGNAALLELLFGGDDASGTDDVGGAGGGGGQP